MWASDSGLTVMVNNLLVHGTDPELTDACDMTSLMVALENRHEAAGEVLLAPTIAAGALDVQDSDGKSALMWASARDWCRSCSCTAPSPS